CTGWFAYW
nr:immunoglobulin heavy chain junction region [Mus musculus]MBK4187230.1 immunoglobulin heavy chain junction region [Mus musculus]MBK4197640.1 immunoglobulin heavy chain junction region [Mus musculus]MBK4197641.1 immunoglobulin heavy chain junction region [Mus musculus]MBK4197642.1 immunoglobulin heavy chain junction region [Mus musculus]